MAFFSLLGLLDRRPHANGAVRAELLLDHAEGQRVDRDVVGGENEGTLHHVLELPHVARPGVLLQALEVPSHRRSRIRP
jgi:hypothetical protein